MGKILKSAAIGLIASVILVVVAIAISSSSNLLLKGYTAPIRDLPFFSQLQTEVEVAALYNAPPPPGITVVFVLSVLLWTAIFGGLYYFWSRRGRSVPKTTESR